MKIHKDRPPADMGVITEQDFIEFFIRSHCTSMSVAEVAKTVLREYELTPRDAAVAMLEEAAPIDPAAWAALRTDKGENDDKA